MQGIARVALALTFATPGISGISAWAASCEEQKCDAGMYVAIVPRFMEDESSPAAGRFLWSYDVRIDNGLQVPVQLVGRRWIVKDALGNVDIYEGPGLVGKEPVLAPAESHRYGSWVSLKTSAGSMEGEILAMTNDGVRFQIQVSPFALLVPK